MEQLLRLYTDFGYSIRKLSEIYKCDRNVVRRFLTENGIEIKDKSAFLNDTIKFTNEERVKVVKLYQEGKSIKVISKEMSMGTSTIRRILSKNNIELRVRYIDLEPHKEEIFKMYEESKSLKEIADLFNISKDTIYKFLKKNGKSFISVLEENKKDIIDSYESGVPVRFLSEKYKVTDAGIYYLLKRNNIKIHGSAIIPKEKYSEVASKYIGGSSSIKLGKEYNVSSFNIQSILKRENIKRRSATENSRIYSLDENFFDLIDTEEKAYFLGFLYADGNVSVKDNSIRLQLKENDRDTLERLNKIIKSNRPLFYNDNMCSLNISSKHMKESVMKWGLVPQKTFILAFPENLDSNLYSHFIRGYFDGDGSLSHNTVNDTYCFSLAGTEKFLLRVQEVLMKECELMKTLLSPVGNIHVLNYGGSYQVLRIKDFIYKDATVYLQRKKDVFDRVVVKENIVEDEKFITSFKETETNREVAEELGVSYKTVYRRLKDLGVSRGRYTVSVDEKEVIRLYTIELKSAQEIGEMYGTTHTTIYRILEQNGIQIRDSHGSLKTLRLLEPHRDEIIDLYVNHKKSAQYIADLNGVNQNTLIKFLRENNVEMRERYTILKSVLMDKEEEVKFLLKSGKKIYEIANHFGVTDSVVKKFMKRWNVSKHDFSANKEDIIDMYNKGMSTIDIAEKFSTNKTTICQYLRLWNVTLRVGNTKMKEIDSSI